MNTPAIIFFCTAVVILCFFYPASTAEAQLFSERVDYAVGPWPTHLATSDLDGDGHPDLVTVNVDNNSVSVLLGSGDGTFLAPVSYGVDFMPIALDIDDLNGDGSPDLVTANWGDSSLSVLLGYGDGTFQPAMSIPTGHLPQSVVIEEFNGDGIPDVAEVHNGAGIRWDQVAIGIGQGDGTFLVSNLYEPSEYLDDLATGDLDGDGHADLVTLDSVVTLDSDNEVVSILLGNGDGTFQTATNYPVSGSPGSVIIGDLDGDGHQDLLTAGSSTYDVSILPGNGDGTFQTALLIETGGYPRSVAIDDLDGDGTPDLAVANSTLDQVSIFRGNGDWTFQPMVGYGTGDRPHTVIINDLDGDGQPDLAVTNTYDDTVSVLINIRGTILAGLTCVPGSGTLPFSTQLAISLASLYPGQTRLVAARLNIDPANGPPITNWRRGFTTITAGSTHTLAWYQEIPALSLLRGDNTFILEAEDVTPAPYNQPPYPPAGDTNHDSCMVTGVAPEANETKLSIGQ